MGIIPELSVQDAGAARDLLTRVFGFSAAGDLLQCGSQTIALRQGAAAGHGVIDHLALSVPDIAAASRLLLDRGAEVDAEVTPDGPKGIAEFWGGGVRYLFLKGPEGARIELCCTLDAPRPFGHDHIGIPCSDIDASRAFALSLGGQVRADVALHRPEGITQVCFVALAGSLLEFYAPPVPVMTAEPGRWSRLLVPGLDRDVTGPGGLRLSPLPG